MLNYPRKVEDEDLEGVSMVGWQVIDCMPHITDFERMIVRITWMSRVFWINLWIMMERRILDKSIVDFKRNQRSSEPAEILFQSRSHRVDIKVRIGNVVVVAAFEAFFYGCDLVRAPRFAIDTLDVHT